MAAATAGGSARLDHREGALEVACGFAGEVFFGERSGEGAFAPARDRSHHQGSRIDQGTRITFA
jgi:hypothetical protein